jgi:Leucine-rich repeat (LRR) protein
MKMRIHLIIIAFVITSSFLQAQIVNIPDANFKAALLKHDPKIDLNDDKEIQLSEAQNVRILNVSYSSIIDITGIKDFSLLSNFNCSNNKINSLDLSMNAFLVSLNCSNNLIISILMSDKRTLKYLNCSNNNLSAFDVRKNDSLTNLICYNNKIDSLDVYKAPNLIELDCSDNILKNVDVSKNASLTKLNCSNNLISSLNVTFNYNLMELRCESSNLTILDITKNTKLTILICGNNKLRELDVSKNTSLTSLLCPKNQLTKLVLYNNTVLRQLYCNDNYLQVLDLINNPLLNSFSCDHNYRVIDNTPIPLLACVYWNQQINGTEAQAIFSTTCHVQLEIPDSNFKSALIANGVDYNNNNIIEEFEPATVSRLNISDKNIKDVTGLSLFYNLSFLDCSKNNIDSLDVSKNENLDTLICSQNQLTTLNLIRIKWLTYLNCSYNQLDSLVLPLGTVLWDKKRYLDCSNNNLSSLPDGSFINYFNYLNCASNKIASIDLTKNELLESFNCSGNNLSTLDITKNKILTSLACDSNQLNTLTVVPNMPLKKLQCNNNQLNNINLRFLPNLTELNCSNNQLNSLDISTNDFLKALNLTFNSNLLKICINSNQYADTSLWQKDSNTKWDSLCAFNNKEVKIQDKYFYFSLYLNGVDSNQDSKIQYGEAEAVTKIRAYDLNIVDMTGIEVFINLDTLICNQNQISVLDLSKNTSLSYLDCSNNQLVNLILGSNVIVVNNNSLERLEGFSNNKLKYLDCSSNLLSTLDVSNEEILTTLISYSNPNLTKICINSKQLNDTINWNTTKEIFTQWSVNCSNPLIINEEAPMFNSKKIVKIYNQIGLTIKPEDAKEGMFIYIFSDGSTRKVVKSVN